MYIDELMGYSPTFEQHLKDLKKVFEALHAANLTVKAFKWRFCHREIRCLGHIITQNAIKSDRDLVKSITNFPQSKKIKEV